MGEGAWCKPDVPNQIVDDSNSDSKEFGWQSEYKSDSIDNFESTIAISIQIWLIFD